MVLKMFNPVEYDIQNGRRKFTRCHGTSVAYTVKPDDAYVRQFAIREMVWRLKDKG